MFKKASKFTIFICILSLFVFSGVQIFSEALIPIKGGRVPVDYLATDAYSAQRLQEGKVAYEEKCGACHTDSGRDMVIFGDPDFTAARVKGSVKKFAGASDDPEIGEKVYEYLRYNHDGAFMSQDQPFLQPGPLELEPGVVNPVLSRREDFWGALTGHIVPTPDDINLHKIWDSYDNVNVVIPFKLATWADWMPVAVPLPAAVAETRTLFNQQRYDLRNLPLRDKGLGRTFNFSSDRIYHRHQFASHAFNKTDHSKDFLEAMYSTSYVKFLALLNFEYGLPQRVNGEWNGPWEFGPHENTILWGPGENLTHINSFAINPQERINSREKMRNEWTNYSLMFVTGKRGSFTPSSYFQVGTMPWGCKIYDGGTFGGQDYQIFLGLKGFADFWNHSQQYPGRSYSGTQGISHYGRETRNFLTAFYWPYSAFSYYRNSREIAVNPFIELIYRQWMASIGMTNNDLRNFRTDRYNLPTVNSDQERYTYLVRAFETLSPAMTSEQRDLVRAYIRRIYPTNPTGYQNSFNPHRWELVDPAPNRPVVVPFGSDTAVAGKPYVLRILRAQAQDGDIEITASNLPSGARLVRTQGNWESDDNEYAIHWTPTSNQAGRTYTINLTGRSNMGSTNATAEIRVIATESPVVLDDIREQTVYVGQELTFPLTVQNYHAEDLEFSMTGSFGKVMNNSWNSAGIFTVRPTESDVGRHTVRFTVKDKLGNTSTKEARITVAANRPPEVVITPDGTGPGRVKNIYRARVGETLRLTINATDPDGDNVEISKTTEFPGFIDGNVYTYTVEEDMARHFPGPNVLTFTVKDMDRRSTTWNPIYKGGETKKVLLVYFDSANSSTNHSPWAIAGSPQTVNSGQRVTLDGTVSDDTNGDPITFRWRQADGPTVQLSGDRTAQPTFTAPNVSQPTVLKFYLTVTDPGGLSDSDVVRVLVNPSSSTTVKLGDINGDGAINSTDYTLLRRVALGIVPVTDDILAAGDLNKDGVINSTDLVLMRRYLLEIITSFN
ncbi:UNVERIFIED_CONTAM: dockerin type I repeat protein [Acetivibrio alkalicellulosi]